MPKPYPRKFRQDVVEVDLARHEFAVARSRGSHGCLGESTGNPQRLYTARVIHSSGKLTEQWQQEQPQLDLEFSILTNQV